MAVSMIPEEHVSLVISVGNETAPMRIKRPGQEEYEEIHSTQGMTFDEQRDLVLRSGVMKGQEIVFFADDEKPTDVNKPKTIDHLRDVNQTHVVVTDSPTTYSGMNSAQQRESLADRTPVPGKTTVGMDIVIMNYDEGTQQEMQQMYGEDFFPRQV